MVVSVPPRGRRTQPWAAHCSECRIPNQFWAIGLRRRGARAGRERASPRARVWRIRESVNDSGDRGRVPLVARGAERLGALRQYQYVATTVATPL
eukprot:COSAG02_NODE_1638_length_11542_cov_13.473739_6_plen_95_part_00